MLISYEIKSIYKLGLCEELYLYSYEKEAPKEKLLDFSLAPHQYLPITYEHTSTFRKNLMSNLKWLENCASRP
ncbi:hypothetical protein PFDG_05241, partial [Plasmodium falciparum Dd2]